MRLVFRSCVAQKQRHLHGFSVLKNRELERLSGFRIYQELRVQCSLH